MSSDIIPAALSGFIIKAGFSKKGRLYTREHHDIMQCILFERPSSLIYPTYFIMPLYIPCSTRYLTYGRRISEITNGRNSKQIDVDRLINALQKEVLPFFERIAAPQLLMEYLLTARDVQRYFFCPPVRIAMLKAYTALYLHDRSLFSRMAAETGQLIPADRCSSEAVARRMHAELEVLKAQARLCRFLCDDHRNHPARCTHRALSHAAARQYISMIEGVHYVPSDIVLPRRAGCRPIPSGNRPTGRHILDRKCRRSAAFHDRSCAGQNVHALVQVPYRPGRACSRMQRFHAGGSNN